MTRVAHILVAEGEKFTLRSCDDVVILAFTGCAGFRAFAPFGLSERVLFVGHFRPLLLRFLDMLFCRFDLRFASYLIFTLILS